MKSFLELRMVPEVRALTYRHLPLLVAFRPSRCYSKVPQKPTSNISHSKELIVPTKHELLKHASGPILRALIHLRWPLTRNNRPSASDVVSAALSWFVMGNLLWIILGTTTFCLMGLYALDTFSNVWRSVSPGETKESSLVGKLTSALVSQGLGIKLEFTPGQVIPELKDGMLRFKNVRVVSTLPETKFDGTIDAVNVSLSFQKWYEGKGIIDELDIYGMHLKLYYENDSEPHMTVGDHSVPSYRFNDTMHYQYDLPSPPENQEASVSPATLIDASYELSLVKLHDSYFDIHESEAVEPFRVAVFNCDLPQLKGDRILLDFFNANIVTGSMNDSLFTIHKRQTETASADTEQRTVRFKLDGIDLGAISQKNPRTKFNWIVNGKAEIIADIRMSNLPEKEDKKFSNVFFSSFRELLSLTDPKPTPSDEQETNESNLLKGALAAIYTTFSSKECQPSTMQNSDYAVVNVKIKLKDLKATLPKYMPMATSTSAPFISLHDLRSLVAFANELGSSSPPIVVQSTAIERLSDLHNTENIFDTRLFDLIVNDVYEELLKMVHLDEKRIIEEKSSLWSHSVASQLLVLGLSAMV